MVRPPNTALYSQIAAAKYVGVSPQAVGQRKQATGYPMVRVSDRFFYEKKWLDRWKREREAAARKVLTSPSRSES